jgi:protein-disulfide isomerase
MPAAGAAATVLMAVVLAGVLVQNLRVGGAGPYQPLSGTTADGYGIPVGHPDAPVTLTVYEDYRCPACRTLEQELGPAIRDLVAAGRLRVEYRLASFLDLDLGGSGSRKAANAAACAHQAGRFAAYHGLLFAEQPPEQEDGFTDARLLALAGQVPGLAGSAFARCVEKETYRAWVIRAQEHFERTVQPVSTPTILLDGRYLNGGPEDAYDPALGSPAALRAAVESAGVSSARPAGP